MNALSGWCLSLPVLILAAGACLLLLLETGKKTASSAARPLIWGVAGLSLLAAFLAFPDRSFLQPLFYGRDMLVWDGLAFWTALIALGGAALTFLLSAAEGADQPKHLPAYLALLLFSVIGTILVGASSNLLMAFVAIELTSIPSFVLVAYTKHRRESVQAALQYFLMGAFASAMIVYGASLLYGLTGTMSISALVEQSAVLQGKMPLLMTGLILILSGLAFKMALVPFQWWLPEAFVGSSSAIAAYLSAAPKVAGLILLLRLAGTQSLLLGDPFFTVVAGLAAVTLVFGNVMGFLQGNVLRLMAYSSVSHMGFMLLGVLAGFREGFPAIAFYALAYLFMNFGAFAVVGLVVRQAGTAELRVLNGLSRRSPLAAALLSIFVISLAGLPPLAGFVGKFYVFLAAYQAGWTKLVILGLLSTVIGCAYYFRIIYVMYFQPADRDDKLTLTVPDRLVLATASFFTVVLGVFPQFILSRVKMLIP